MNDSIFDWLDDGARAYIEEARQPKPMPPAKKKKTVTRLSIVRKFVSIPPNHLSFT